MRLYKNHKDHMIVIPAVASTRAAIPKLGLKNNQANPIKNKVRVDAMINDINPITKLKPCLRK